MSYDNLCKRLVEKNPLDFIRWLLSAEIISAEVVKTELSLEPIRADAVILLRAANQILHLEFQTTPESEPPLPLRMLDYWVRLHREYRCPITQIIVFLKRTNVEAVFTEEFRAENTGHRYRVIRLWEQDPAPLLANPGLLPLATLAKTDSPETLLQQVAAQVATIEETSERQNLSASVELLAGLRFEKNLIRRIFSQGMIRESVIYQEILAEGLQQGLQQGRQEGRQEGELALIFRLLGRKFGGISPKLQKQIQQLSILELEALAEALLDFEQVSDLTRWLAER